MAFHCKATRFSWIELGISSSAVTVACAAKCFAAWPMDSGLGSHSRAWLWPGSSAALSSLRGSPPGPWLQRVLQLRDATLQADRLASMRQTQLFLETLLKLNFLWSPKELQPTK